MGELPLLERVQGRVASATPTRLQPNDWNLKNMRIGVGGSSAEGVFLSEPDPVPWPDFTRWSFHEQSSKSSLRVLPPSRTREFVASVRAWERDPHVSGGSARFGFSIEKSFHSVEERWGKRSVRATSCMCEGTPRQRQLFREHRHRAGTFARGHVGDMKVLVNQRGKHGLRSRKVKQRRRRVSSGCERDSGGVTACPLRWPKLSVGKALIQEFLKIRSTIQMSLCG